MNFLLIFVLSVSMATVYGTAPCDFDEGVYQTVEDSDKYIVYFLWEFEGGSKQIPVYFVADCGAAYNGGIDYITPECPAVNATIDGCPDVYTTTLKPTTTTTPTTMKPTTTTTPTITTPVTPSTTAVPIDDYDFLPFECESPGYTGFCKKFYYCRPTAHGYDKIEKECPDGEMFNPDFGTCTPKIHETCQPFNCTYAGFFRHPRNCMHYISCPDVGGGATSNGRRKLYKCPDGYFYKNVVGSNPCVVAHSAATCDFPGVIPDPETLSKDSECKTEGEGMFSVEGDPSGIRMCMRQHGQDVSVLEQCQDRTHFHQGSQGKCTV